LRKVEFPPQSLLNILKELKRLLKEYSTHGIKLLESADK